MGSLAPGILSIFVFLVFTNNPASSQLNARSCAELEQYGLPSGIYRIDPDGPSNGIAPFNVTCDMSTGATIFEHSQENRVVVNGYEEPYSYEWVIDYDGLTPDQIGAVVDASDHCVQYIKYECIYSMIRNFAAWYNRHGQRIDSWGGAPKDSGKCMCGVTGTCQYEKAVCNCNLNDGKWREDEGNITDKSDLPVTAIRAGDTGLPFEKAYITLGPLVCWSVPSHTPLVLGKSTSREKPGIPMPRVTKRSITPAGIDVRVTCGSDSMTVYLNITHLVNQGVLAEHLHFLDDDCVGRSYGGSHNLVKVSGQYDECDFTVQERGENIVYSNTISCDKEYPVNTVITRHICDMAIDVRCELPRRKIVNQHYNPTSSTIEQEEVGYGSFIISFLRYTDNTFSQVHDDEETPVHLRETLYYAVNLTKNPNITLFINRCWSTPVSSPSGNPKYYLIRNGCPSDATVQLYPISHNLTGFSFEAFQFIRDSSEVYIHCEVIACLRGDLNSRCAQGCRGQGRKRRSLGRLQGSNSKPRIVSQMLGPFVMDDDGGVKMEAHVESSHSVVSGIGAATLCIFIGMMAMYTVMKTRIKKMVLNRET